MCSFLPSGPLLGRDNYDIGFAALARDENGCVAIRSLVQVAGQVLAQVGVCDVIHKYRLLYVMLESKAASLDKSGFGTPGPSGIQGQSPWPCLAYTEKYLAFGFNTTIALVDCSGCNCHSSDSEMPTRSASSNCKICAWSSSFGQAG